MISHVCFPFFDSRFARALAERGDYELAPRWLLDAPPPPLARVGGLGRVTKHIPPPPYACAEASDLITVYADEAEHPDVSLKALSIELLAGQHGHARLRATLEVQPVWSNERTLSEVVEGVATAQVAVRHPKRRGLYESLGQAAPYLADLYARESARTAPKVGRAYEADWVRFGRPFLILANTRREPLATSAAMIEVPVSHPAYHGRIWFFPWRSSEEDLAMPVWYLHAPRGGDAWLQPAEALEDATATHEELFLCLMTRAEIEARSGDCTLTSVLDRYAKQLSGRLRKPQRHGVNLRVALRLLSDYDKSSLQPREGSDYEETLLARVHEQIGDRIRAPLREVDLTERSLNVTIYQGNVINYGVMRENTISVTNTILEESQASSDLKDKLKELRDPLLEAAKELPETEAKALLKDYETFTELALREAPPKAVVEAQGNHIVETVKKVAAFATPVATIVAAILKIVTG